MVSARMKCSNVKPIYRRFSLSKKFKALSFQHVSFVFFSLLCINVNLEYGGNSAQGELMCNLISLQDLEISNCLGPLPLS